MPLMSPINKRTVRFVRVNTNGEKQNTLCHIVMDHFSKKERTAIFVPTNEAAAYIDQLLWNQPKEGFIPHAVCHGPTDEPVAITTRIANVNNARAIVNLTPNALLDGSEASMIYELNDMTSADKEALSRSKQQAYTDAGFVIEVTG